MYFNIPSCNEDLWMFVSRLVIDTSLVSHNDTEATPDTFSISHPPPSYNFIKTPKY